MAIKVRKSKDYLPCCECGSMADEVLDMFDFRIGRNIFHICNFCNEQLSERSNHALVYVNHRVKTRHEIQVANAYRRRFKI